MTCGSRVSCGGHTQGWRPRLNRSTRSELGGGLAADSSHSCLKTAQKVSLLVDPWDGRTSAAAMYPDVGSVLELQVGTAHHVGRAQTMQLTRGDGYMGLTSVQRRKHAVARAHSFLLTAFGGAESARSNGSVRAR